ncbi:Oidioi.mRNA.OKI2018_I69.chr1.g339.t1.cds [Oikopleura dioica]|uniref:Glyceraldehyde-3-phosphate dehydrogenase n=1 Tax=Oikopleura dioica TaxID=34765 RepID=A0ABN7SN96_OIKDI|nr:Oidioi.mRNA.OKI2018_I69.chr1.g339.t1.cds [Oikopleura dioica]
MPPQERTDFEVFERKTDPSSSKIRVGLNGFGRIGRCVTRILAERENIEIVAINHCGPIDYMCYKLKYDSTHGTFNGSVEPTQDGDLMLNGKRVHVFSTRDINELNWASVGADYVIESTGVFNSLEKCQAHLDNGARKVIITAPSPDAPMFVFGVNHQLYSPEMRVISNASCTTNCLAPVVKIINDNFGVKEALMTTIHSYTASQTLVDGSAKGKKSWRDARGGAVNIIPATTGAAKACTKVIPELAGKITGMAFRVPTPNVSVVDLTVKLEKETSYEVIMNTIKDSAVGDLKNVVQVTDVPLVSSDYNTTPFSSSVDAAAGMELNSTFYKIIIWYDNEWGYSQRVVDLLQYAASREKTKIKSTIKEILEDTA